jgi:signal transduction histidine kinase
MQVQRDRSQEQTIEALQREVEALKRDNLLLQDQLDRKDQFTAMIAHDLRGPLSPIISYAQRIESQVSTLENESSTESQPAKKEHKIIKRGTHIIISQARRMNRQVNDLLDISNIASGNFKLVREECDLVQLAEDMIEQLQPVAPYHKLVVVAPKRPITGNWDSLRLQQALGNLLDNAIKYSDEHTTVTVKITSKRKLVHLSVHNEGVSLPPAAVAQLFQPYGRLPETSEKRGTGLGLYITKSIIEAHGGTLSLEPSREKPSEGGTTFSFELPR